MNKLLTFIFIVSLSLNIYFLTTKTAYVETVSDSFDTYKTKPNHKLPVEDEINLAQASIKKTECPPPQNIDEVKQEFMQAPSQVELEKDDEFVFDEKEYQKASEQFYESANKKIAEFLEYKVGLNFEQVDKYYELKNNRQKEIDEYIQSRFSEMQENGAKHLILSMEDTIEMGKINQKYLERLKSNIGDDAYERYQDFKQALNNQSQSEENFYGFFIDF